MLQDIINKEKEADCNAPKKLDAIWGHCSQPLLFFLQNAKSNSYEMLFY
jgi:hypothetical protein